MFMAINISQLRVHSLCRSQKTADNSSWTVQVKHGVKSPLSNTSRQVTAWKKTFRDAEKTAVTRKEPTKRKIIFFIIHHIFVNRIRETLLGKGFVFFRASFNA
jgi:hypothetical protein